jgi:hypothetical protein
MKEIFKNIFSSATKTVFIIIAFALVAFTAVGIIDGKDFINIALMVFTAYYSKNATGAETEKKEKIKEDITDI